MKIVTAIGTYTSIQPHVPGACGRGIEILNLDTATGTLTSETVFTDIDDPTYLCWDRETGKLSAVTESPDSDGLISSFSISAGLELTGTGTIPGPGKAGCYIATYPDIKRIYSASYIGGKTAGYRTENGTASEQACSREYSGSGPNKERQQEAHAHMIARSIKHSRLFVCDLGSDTVWSHRLNSSGDIEKEEAALKLPGGYGPRHMALSTDEDTAFILCELIPRLVTARIGNDDRMEIISDIATVKNPEGSPSNPAAIRIHPGGRTIAVSNRFQDTIGIFKIEYSAGVPAPVLAEEFDCRGKTPRDINFTPDGDWLVIANQDSNNIETRRFSPETGMPEKEWGPGLNTGSPVCITFL